jgi:hypothetical protein
LKVRELIPLQEERKRLAQLEVENAELKEDLEKRQKELERRQREIAEQR